ncbi:MAG: siderophore-interacting protein [Treponema sp.]|nr:MAG: siderophore-interacting protein [Treponema sp.]
MVLTSVGCWFVGIALFSVYIFSQMIFSWMFAFFPIPYIVGILWVTYAFSLTIVFDRKEVLLLILRFLAFTLLFGVIAGLISGYVLSNIRNFQMQLVVIVGAVSVVFFVRQITQNKLFWIFGETKDYEKPFERALQEIDFTKGREDVMHDITEALRVYMGCSGIDILVTDDNFVMQTVFSSIDNTNRFDTTVSAFDYLINKNIQVLFQTELVTKYEYEEIRPDLNVIFSKTGADVMVFVRDNQRIIGAFALGKKSNKSEYGTYDLNVIKSFYSYFFLVIYYLRNIAKQNIVMTVDREVEMSDQIISSIQGAVEKIESKQIEIDSLNYSAYKLGGDFIDFLRLSENRYFFLIGDVAGKGLSASMSMVILKSVLHTFLEESQDFKELVVKMNLFVKQNLPKGTFFAGLFGIVDFSTGSVYYLNCGIPLMSMYISTYKNAIEIQGEGRVLGFVKNIKPFLKVRKIVMNPGDVIVFTTDGLLESENLRGDRFGKDRVSSILTESNAQPAKEITKAIYDRLNDFVSSELQDDVTILVFKHTGQ